MTAEPTLGTKEFEDPINDVDALEARLLQWHLANLEYACAVNIREVMCTGDVSLATEGSVSQQ